MRLEELFANEGINDPSIFKAVFLAGGPGSGKSYVSSKILAGSGLKTVNPDEALELLMDKEGLRKDMPDDEQEERDIVRKRAKGITGNQQALYIAGRLGLIIDGTAKDTSKVERIKKELEEIGYETRMIFVNTNLEVSVQRNTDRCEKEGGRKVPADILKKSWQNVQDNMMQFQQLFGPKRFYIVDNSGGLEDPDRKKNFDFVWKDMKKFLDSPPKNKAALQWINAEKNRDRSPNKDQIGSPFDPNQKRTIPQISPGFSAK